MKTFIVILFFIGGEWGIVQGYYPIEMVDMEHCQQRKEVVQQYFDKQPNIPDFHLTCIQAEEGKGGEVLKEYISKNLAEKI